MASSREPEARASPTWDSTFRSPDTDSVGVAFNGLEGETAASTAGEPCIGDQALAANRAAATPSFLSRLSRISNITLIGQSFALELPETPLAAQLNGPK